MFFFLNLNNWNVSGVTNLTQLVDYCTNLKNFKAPKNISVSVSDFSRSANLTVESMIDIIDKTKSTLGVHSPSTVYYEIGENVIDGMVNGITDGKTKIVNTFSDLGTQTGKTFIEKFNAELQNIFSSFSAITSPVFSAAAGVAGSLNTQIPVNNNQANSGLINPQNGTINYSYNSLTKSDVVSAIKEAQPDGDVILKVNDAEFGRIARSSLNTLAKSSGNMGLKV